MDIATSFENGVDSFIEWLPNVLGALAILVIGWFIAAWLGRMVMLGLRRVRFDEGIERSSGGRWTGEHVAEPSRIGGLVVKWALILGVIAMSVNVLGVDAFTDFVASVYAYLPNVAAAIAIFVVAGLVATGLVRIVERALGDTPTGKLLTTGVPVFVMALAGFMILDQLQIAGNIVVITYAALLGSVALGMAIAFGLGGREVARDLLDDAYARTQGGERAAGRRREMRMGRSEYYDPEYARGGEPAEATSGEAKQAEPRRR